MFALLVFLHAVSTAVWLGGHLVLALTILPKALRERDPEFLLAFEQRFESIGLPALLVAVLSGGSLAILHSGSESSAATVNLLLALKLAFLFATGALAAHARTRVLPELDEARLRTLAWHVRAVTVLALLLAAAGVAFRIVSQN